MIVGSMTIALGAVAAVIDLAAAAQWIGVVLPAAVVAAAVAGTVNVWLARSKGRDEERARVRTLLAEAFQAYADYGPQRGRVSSRWSRSRCATWSNDLLGALARARDEGDRLSEGELIDLGIAVLIAGHETTMSQIGNMTYILLTHPERGSTLRGGHEAVARRVEELLRYAPIIAAAGFPRIATEDVELSGVTVRAGETVVVSLNAANRDPELFDDAEVLLLGRAANRHIGFGYGAHHCPGAALARMELQGVLKGLLRELPDLRLAVAPGDVQWRTGARVRGPRALPLAWGSENGGRQNGAEAPIPRGE